MFLYFFHVKSITMKDMIQVYSIDIENKFLKCLKLFLNLLNANPTKWSNTLEQFVGNLPTNCLTMFDHFVGLTLKGLIWVCETWVFHYIDQ